MGLARQFIIFIWKLHQVHFVFWLLVFALCLFFLSLIGFNLYCWKGIHFSWSNFLTFLHLFLYLICSFCGWCLRYFHSSGASFVFLFLFLHLGRALVYGSYFYNPNTWFSGILLLFFLMAIAFMGYV